jgi:hypothetical protein
VNGIHKIEVRGATGGAALFQFFTNKPSLAVQPTTGEPGATHTATTAGYRAGETVNVAWFSTATASSVVASGTASALGSLTVAFAIPANATAGDHKVEATGLSSFQKASAIVSVIEASGGSEGGSTANPPPPAEDVAFSDDFQQATADGGPVGWTLAPGSSETTTVSVRTGGGGRLTFAAPAGAGGTSWLLRDGVVFTRPDVQAKLGFSGNGAGAGIVLAWTGPNDYVVVLANADLDRLELIEVVGGVVRTSFATERGSVTIKPDRSYWLRAESGSDGSGRTWVSLSWSDDGKRLEPVAAVEGLANLWGAVGLVTTGNNAPEVEFDEVSVRKSEATQPVDVASDEGEQTDEEATATPEATEEPVATETETPEATPDVTEEATEEPTAEVPPTETATPEPPSAETPVPEPAAPAPTEEATEEPAPEPPPADEGGGAPEGEGDATESEAA